MINQRWLYTKQAIQRYLQGIIFLWKKTLSFIVVFISVLLRTSYCMLSFLKKKKHVSKPNTIFGLLYSF